MWKTWEIIGEILKNKNKKPTVTDTFIASNGVPCTDIANNVNTYVTTVGTHLQQSYHKHTTIQLN